MAISSRTTGPGRWIACGLLVVASLATGWAQSPGQSLPHWIWSPQHRAGHVPAASCYFRRTVELTNVRQAVLAIAADDHFEVHINGRRVGQGTSRQGVQTFDVTPRVRDGANAIAVKVNNREGATAGLAARLVVTDARGTQLAYVTDSSWRTSLGPALFWTRLAHSDERWQSATELGLFGDFLANQQENLRRAAQVANTETDSVEPPAAEADKPADGGTVGGGTAERSITRTPAAGEHLQVPDGFRCEQIAGHDDVGSITAITFNERGELVVAREDGQLWRLDDSNQDRTLDAVHNLGHVTKTCQGMLWFEGKLFVSALTDEGLGLYRLDDTDADGQLDRATLIVPFQGDNLEHGPHGIVLGPDGLLYTIVGNHSPLKGQPAASSPYRYAYEGDLLKPRFEDPGGHARGITAPGGYVLRTDVDGKHAELFAAGIRNAYDLAFDRDGNLYTHDSDMESDRGTTWYRPTRVCQVIDGAELGWRSGWSKWPEYFLDSLPAIADTGRGSPAGMVVYDHEAFPVEFRGTLFSCDWSEGRIWAISLADQGAGRSAAPREFIRGEPLNVTDIEVGPDGALYFATGGRGTAGSIYRVVWTGEATAERATSTQPLDQAVRQPQLASAWARGKLSEFRQRLGPNWEPQLVAAARDRARSDPQRVQAMRILQQTGPAPSLELVSELSHDASVAVRRQATWMLGQHIDPAAVQRLNQLLADDDPVIRRRACEGLARQQQPADLAALEPLLTCSDRFAAWAARRVLETTPRASWQSQVLSTDNPRLFLLGATALALAAPEGEIAEAIVAGCLQRLDGYVSDEDFVDMLRVLQVTVCRAELTAETRAAFRDRLAEEYPSTSAVINRELIRLLVYLQADAIIDRYVHELGQDWPSDEKLHLAMHLTFLKSGWSSEQKLTVLQHLATPDQAGNSVPGYLQNAALQFGQQLTAAELSTALQNGAQNPACALVALLRFDERLSGEQRTQLATLDQQLAEQSGESAGRLQVAIVAVLARDGQAESCRLLREMYERDPSRRAEIALGLAESGDDECWPYLIRSLPLLEAQDLRQVLTKLREVRRWPDDADAYRQVILAAQRLADDGATDAIRLLEHWQGFAPSDGNVSWQSAVEAWKRWYRQSYPDEPLPELVIASGAGKWDPEALRKHLAESEQQHTGSVTNGRAIFVKAQCATCHRLGDHGEAMGPDLTGLARRFLQREVLDSILFPSKVISDQYAAKVVTTVKGQTYTGLVAQGPGDQLTVLQSDGKKVRLQAEDVDELHPSGVSAMPEGLLDELTLAEITDLFAYLQADPRRVTQVQPASRR